MGLLAQAQAVEVAARTSGPQQAVRTLEIDPANLEELVAAIETQFPKAELHEAPIIKQGLAPTGDRMVPFAVKQRIPAGNCTVYYTGKVVLAGSMTELTWPPVETE